MIPIAGVAALAFAGIRFGFLSPPNASTLIRVRRGGIHVAQGSLKSHAREQVTKILSDAGVSGGFIAITVDNRVRFSGSIPGEIHQRLRNVLLNQWI